MAGNQAEVCTIPAEPEATAKHTSSQENNINWTYPIPSSFGTEVRQKSKQKFARSPQSMRKLQRTLRRRKIISTCAILFRLNSVQNEMLQLQ